MAKYHIIKSLSNSWWNREKSCYEKKNTKKSSLSGGGFIPYDPNKSMINPPLLRDHPGIAPERAEGLLAADRSMQAATGGGTLRWREPWFGNGPTKKKRVWHGNSTIQRWGFFRWQMSIRQSDLEKKKRWTIQPKKNMGVELNIAGV